MCFGGGGGSQPSMTSLPMPTPGVPPPPPKQAVARTQMLQSTQKEPSVRPKSNQRERLGMRRGSSQLRIPLNTGSSQSGGLNT
jgi:hypothetical protein